MLNFYHSTNHSLKVLDYKELLTNITGHKNGALGLWASTELVEWTKGFGTNIYKISIPEKAKSVDISISTLMSWADEYTIEDYIKLRQMYLEDKVIYLNIVELNDKIEMIVLLNFENVIPVLVGTS